MNPLGDERVGYVTLFSDRTMRTLWIGQMTSAVGSRLYQMAILWLVWKMSGSTESAGLTALFSAGASLLGGFVAGSLADRINRVRLAYKVDGLRVVIGSLLPVLYALGLLKVWMVFVVIVIMSGLAAIFDPCFEALLPNFIQRDELPQLLGLMDTPSRIARLVGPGMASIFLTAMPVVGFFALDSSTFLVSAVSLWLVQRWGTESSTWEQVSEHRYGIWNHIRTALHDMKSGIDVVKRDLDLTLVFALDVLGNILFATFTLGALVYSVRVLHAGAGVYGVLIAAYGLGGVFGNLVAASLVGSRTRSWLAISGWGGIGLGLLLLATVHSLQLAVVCVLGAGGFGAMAHVSRSTLIATRISSVFLGRVHALRGILGTISSAIGMALCGVFLSEHSIETALFLSGGILFTVDVAVLVGRLVSSIYSGTPAGNGEEAQ